MSSLDDLRLEFVSALIGCLRTESKKERWLEAIEKLSCDQNFSNMGLSILNTRYISLKDNTIDAQVDSDEFRDLFYQDIQKYLSRMSSGHAIVLFTVTRLVDTVGEKSLVLLDEPEGHLHPPLLAAFLRTLSDLLYAKNGVAIIATHSPVVLQEVPKSCVWKVIRSREAITVKRPDIETFGENLGVLTREVFSLEVESSGYHSLLAKSVESGLSYEDILTQYGSQIGLEGRTVLKAMVLNRDSGKTQ
ncbi:ATP-binding protein [Vibrio ishigakensis]|uniref:ATP-binding protein n=1 Tax=Vibrio ishigakensis TaxID=1481914 RepID=UPI0021C3378B|nr:ATP-binding protein [Vibrio ishigakensis]